MRVRLSRFVLATLLVSSGSAMAADRPPQDLKLVDGHWTAWNPPTPPPGEQVHVIARGDTLWDLAARYYGDPYLWPQLWERNQYILDAHWIYPGDPLVLGIQVAPVDNLAEGQGGPGGPGGLDPAAPPPEGALSAQDAASAPIPLGAESDIYCQGFVGDMAEPFPFSIVGSETEALALGPAGTASGSPYKFGEITMKIGLSTGDIVYTDGGRSRGLSAGKLFTIVQADRPVVHPVRREVVGRYYRYLGRVRILSVQESTSIAEIVHSCEPVTLGAFLQEFEPEPVPLARVTAMRPVNYPPPSERLETAPAIVYVRDEILALGADHVVHVDVGADQATPGDMYSIYRMNKPGLPPVIVGELAILSTKKSFSVGKILTSRYPIQVGDRLEPK